MGNMMINIKFGRTLILGIAKVMIECNQCKELKFHENMCAIVFEWMT